MALADLQATWFLLLGFLFAMYTILDGFDLGIGSLFLFLGRRPEERRALMRIMGPLWDGNEVWLLAGAMALFGAFPHVYATVFSGFYLALMLVLLGLVLRAASFEFWSIDDPHRALWDTTLVIGSFLPTLLLGVGLGNVVVGVPLGADMEYAGDFGTLLRPLPLLVGLLGFAIVLLQGATYAVVKTDGQLQARARRIQRFLQVLVLPLLVVVALLTFVQVPEAAGRLAFLAAIAAAVALWFGNVLASRRGEARWAFRLSSGMIASLWAAVGALHYPNLVRASNDPSLSLTVANASSPEATLTAMLVVVAVGILTVLLYTAYIYRIFRGKVPVTV